VSGGLNNPWAPKDWEDFEGDSLEASFSQSQPIPPGIVVESAPHTVFDGDSKDPQPDSEPFVPAPITVPVVSKPPPEVATPDPVNVPPTVVTPVSATPVTEIEPVDAPAVRQPVDETILVDSQSQPFGSSFSGSVSNIVDAEDRDRTVISKTASIRWALISSAGTSPSFAAGRVIVGRKPAQLSDHPEASLVELADPTRTVSKNHALLEFIDGMWWISDLDSTNGVALVRLDGSESRVTLGQRVALTEKCYLGDLLLTLSVSGA
jgi:hypothetical protein